LGWCPKSFKPIVGREEIEEMEEGSTEIENQRSKTVHWNRARLCSRSTGGECRSAARSTGVHDVHRVSPVDRPIDWGRERSTSAVDKLTGLCSRLDPVDRRGRPWHGSVDRQTRFDFPFGIQIPSLDGIESNLGFLKSRDSVVINKG